ncbi:LysE family translocator [Corallincola platygyrae]|uniref:LysE family translocator n=1 Tax=Corallincola platygyrae TaxID=1193278 RepID=A0ABW4XKV6_9GAMM
MSIETLSLFVAVSLGLLLVPGPLVMLTIDTACKYRTAGALWLALGSATSGLLKAIAAMAGVASLLTMFPIALTLLQAIGAVYLLWLALQIFREFSNSPQLNGELSDELKQLPVKLLFVRGLTTALANPKGILFFAALFPQFINANDSLWQQSLVLMAIFSSLELIVMLAYAAITTRVSTAFSGNRAWFDVVRWVTPLVLISASGAMWWDIWNSY